MTKTTALEPAPVPEDACVRQSPMRLDATALVDWPRYRDADMDGRGAVLSLLVYAWTNVPAGSLPGSDLKLAAICGAASVEAFQRVRSLALAGWKLHADGRLYNAKMTQRVLAALKVQERNRRNRNGGGDPGGEEEVPENDPEVPENGAEPLKNGHEPQGVQTAHDQRHDHSSDQSVTTNGQTNGRTSLDGKRGGYIGGEMGLPDSPLAGSLRHAPVSPQESFQLEGISNTGDTGDSSRDVREKKPKARRSTKQPNPANDGSFARFWAAWDCPGRSVRKGKAEARIAWDTAVLHADPDRIIQGVRDYMRSLAQPNAPLLKYPQGWLTARRWEDETEEGSSHDNAFAHGPGPRRPAHRPGGNGLLDVIVGGLGDAGFRH